MHDELQNVELANEAVNSLMMRALRAMWISHEAVIEVLRKILNDDFVDTKRKAAATGLLAKVLRVDFVASLMFMRIILWKTKVLKESLQKEYLNIVDALEAVNGTVKSLQDIRKDDEGISNQIQTSNDVLARNDVDTPAEFVKMHRPRSRPRRLDDDPESAAEMPMMNFYDREFKEVLDNLITQYRDNINASLEKVKALSILLQPPLSTEHTESDVKDIPNLFPHQASDQAAFTAEFEVFVNVANEGNTTNRSRSLADATKEAEKRKHIFPLTNRVYRTFSKLKTVKTALRNSMSDHRLQNLLLLNSKRGKGILQTVWT